MTIKINWPDVSAPTSKIRLSKSTSEELQNSVHTALKIIASKPVGQRLLKKIDEGKYWVLITSLEDSDTSPETRTFGPGGNISGMGCPSIISISEKHNFTLIGYKHKLYSTDLSPIAAPFWISLAHELIHAYHNSYGRNCQRQDLELPFKRNVWKSPEELKTITGWSGIEDEGGRVRQAISENAIRLEHNLPLRYSCCSSDALQVPQKKRKLVQGTEDLKSTPVFQHYQI